jgi:adenylyl cyclase-associated protein
LVDNCRKTGVVIDSVVSNVEIIRGNALQVQIIDQVPTMVIDSTDSVQIYLSETALGLQLHTSKCSSINLLLPDPENDYVEKPIPEQFVSRIVDGTIVTEPAVHVG